MHGHFDNILNYLLESSLCLLAFHLLYVLLLKRNTFFHSNRFYLLLTAFAAAAIPFLSFEWQGPSSGTPSLMDDLPLSVAGTTEVIKSHFGEASGTAPKLDKGWGAMDWLLIIYSLGVSFFGLRFLGRLHEVGRFIKAARQGGKIPLGMDTSSFFGYIFLHPRHKGEYEQVIWEHEVAHAREWHSLDIIVMEILNIIHWFNPVVYSYKKNIREVHEFLADQHACKIAPSKYHYACILLGERGRLAPSHINNHFASLIKKRLIMLSTKKSNRFRMIHYAAVIPVFIAMLALFSFESIPPNDTERHHHQKGDKYSLQWGDVELSSNCFGYSIPYFSAAMNKETFSSTQGKASICLANGEVMTELGENFQVTVLPLDEQGKINKDPMRFSSIGGPFNSERLYSLVEKKIDRHGIIYISKIFARYRNEASEFTDTEPFITLTISDSPEDSPMDDRCDDDKAEPHPVYGTPYISTGGLYLKEPNGDSDDPRYSPLTDQDKFTFLISDKAACMEGCQSSDNPYACTKERIKAFILENTSLSEEEKAAIGFSSIHILMDEEGKVTKAHIRSKDGRIQGLSRKLETAFSFEPASHNGKRVKYYLKIPIKL